MSGIASNSRQTFQQQFNTLSGVGLLNDAISSMGTFRLGKVFGHYAMGDMLISKDGETYSYPIIFEQDSNGIWRVKSF